MVKKEYNFVVYEYGKGRIEKEVIRAVVKPDEQALLNKLILLKKSDENDSTVQSIYPSKRAGEVAAQERNGTETGGR